MVYHRFVETYQVNKHIHSCFCALLYTLLILSFLIPECFSPSYPFVCAAVIVHVLCSCVICILSHLGMPLFSLVE